MKSKLDKADFRGVTISNTQLQGVSLEGAIFWEWQRDILRESGADLKNAVFKQDRTRSAPRVTRAPNASSE